MKSRILFAIVIMGALTAAAQPPMNQAHPENELYYKTVSQRDAAFKQKCFKETIALCNSIDTLPHFERCGNGAASNRTHNALLRIHCYDSLHDFKKVLELGLVLSFEPSVNGYATPHYDVLKKALQTLHPNYQKELANALDSQSFKVVSKTIAYKSGGKTYTYLHRHIPFKIYDYTIEVKDYGMFTELEKPLLETAKAQFLSDYYKKTMFYKVIVLGETPERF